MLVRVIKCSTGCNFEPGQLLRMGDKEAQNLIIAGFAERADESEVQKWEPSVNSVPLLRGNGFMLPPRFLHGCGYVAKSAEDLEVHSQSCV